LGKPNKPVKAKKPRTGAVLFVRLEGLEPPTF